MKFETVRVHFMSDFFDVPCVVIRNFATMATWRNDFSSLLVAGLRKEIEQ